MFRSFAVLHLSDHPPKISSKLFGAKHIKTHNPLISRRCQLIRSKLVSRRSFSEKKVAHKKIMKEQYEMPNIPLATIGPMTCSYP
jgi:hypothetical protein